MPRKNRKNHAVATASAATSPDASTTPVVNAAPVTPTPDVNVPAVPARPVFGARHSMLASAVPTLLAAYAARAVSTKRNARYPFLVNLLLPNLTANDAPALLNLAASILAGVGANIPGATPTDFGYLDSLTAYYYANHGKHNASQHISDLDRVQTAAAVAEMLVANADRLCNCTARRCYDGGYNGTDPSATRRDSVASHVAALLTPAP